MTGPRPIRVLMIEDDPGVGLALRIALELEGYEVSHASNGSEGMTQLQGGTDRFGLILLDLMMPIMDGWQFLKQFRAQYPQSTIPIIVMSAADERLKPSGINEFLPKPVELEVLLERCRKYLPLTP